MSAEDKALTQKVFREYGEYLDKAGIPYKNDQNGFYVYIPLQNIEHSFTKIYRKYNGKIRIGDLCGSCYKRAKSASVWHKSSRSIARGLRSKHCT